MTQTDIATPDMDQPISPSSDVGRGICLSDVSYSLEGKSLFEGLSLRITEQRVALIGRNGSGKSTLSRLICGLAPPQEGAITINDVDVLANREKAIRTIGLIFQNPDHQIIFPTVEEEVAFGLESLLGNKKAAKDEARAFLARFGRLDWAERNTFALSQGQRHLVCLMAVLAMQPAVILLDEPFAGLDMPTTHRLFAWLQSLEQQIVLVTHDIEQIRAFDRVIWIEQGQIAGDGTPDDVLPAYKAAMQSHCALAEEELGNGALAPTEPGAPSREPR